MIGTARALVRAFQLVDIPLLDRRAEGCDPTTQLALAVERIRIPDDATAATAIQKEVSAHTPLRKILDELCDDVLFEARDGQPALRPGILAREMLRILDPDAMTCFCPFLEPRRQDAFDWPVIPMGDDGPLRGLFAADSLETHIHLGGSLPPSYYWILLMSGRIGLEALAGIRSDRQGNAPAERWVAAVRGAMGIRLSLAYDLQDKWARQRCDLAFPHLPQVSHPAWQRIFEERSHAEEEAFRAGEPISRTERRASKQPREAAISLANASADRQSPARREGRREPFPDPLRPGSSRGRPPHYASGERRLLCLTARGLRGTDLFLSPDTAERWEKRLREYLRIRNAFHGALVHDDGSHGLMRFIESFGKRGALVGGRRSRRGYRFRRLLTDLERSRMTAALDAQLVEPYQAKPSPAYEGARRSIEMRVSIPDRFLIHTLRAWLEGAMDHLGNLEAKDAAEAWIHFGLLFHLVKSGEKPHRNREELARTATRRLWWLLQDYPNLRPWILGLDAAGFERLAEPRLFAPAFRMLQQRAAKYRRNPHDPPIRLGYTYHVGEDMDDLLTGLRHLDEVVHLLLPEGEGGRLGHALALGIPARDFYRGRRYITEPNRATHLLDLIWARGRLEREGQLHQHAWLVPEILRVARPQAVPIHEVARCYRSMRLEEADSPIAEARLLADLGIRDLPREPWPRPIDEPWLSLLTDLQSLLRRDFATRRLCIEANPTSNLLIGGFGGYRDLPYALLVEAGLPLSLNTDDPGLFMTNLPGEFAAMYGALPHLPRHRDLLAWLEDRKRDAARFTFLGRPLPLPIGPDAGKKLDRLFARERR